MSAPKQHIDLNRLHDYFSGKMNPEEMYALEMEAQQDSFLYEAMEGYELEPEGLKRISKLQKAQLRSSKSFFGKTTLVIIAIAGVVYLTALLIHTEIKVPQDSDLVKADSSHYEEIEVIPEGIDTFIYAKTDEQITPTEIKNNKPKIQESNEVLEQQLEEVLQPDFIKIDEKPEIEKDNELIPEKIVKTPTRQAPHIYLYDMYVVDYSSIERKNEVISYTRYEFSGLSAEFEDEIAREKSYDRETEVEVPYMKYLDRSMYYFSKGQYKKALTRYITILEQYPEDLNAHFYGALCYFDMQQYDLALNLLTKIQAYEIQEGFIAFRQEAKWYQARTLIKLGRTSEANTILDEIIAEGLFYAPDAIQLKAKI